MFTFGESRKTPSGGGIVSCVEGGGGTLGNKGGQGICVIIGVILTLLGSTHGSRGPVTLVWLNIVVVIRIGVLTGQAGAGGTGGGILPVPAQSAGA